MRERGRPLRSMVVTVHQTRRLTRSLNCSAMSAKESTSIIASGGPLRAGTRGARIRADLAEGHAIARFKPGDLFVPALGPLLVVVGVFVLGAVVTAARCGLDGEEEEVAAPFRGASEEGGFYRWRGTFHEFTARIPALPEGTQVRTDLLYDLVEDCEGGRQECCRWVYVLMLVEKEDPGRELGRVEIQTVPSFGVQSVQVRGREAEVGPWARSLADSVEGRAGRCQ